MDTTRGRPPRYSSLPPGPTEADRDGSADDSIDTEAHAADLPEALPDDDIEDDALLADTVSSGAQTPASKVADNDELERFRREWKQEVQSRAPPPSTSRTPAPTAAVVSSTQETTENPDVATDQAAVGRARDDEAPLAVSQDPLDRHDSSIDDELIAKSKPIPEAEIYGPAALKYSKGAHKLPHPRPPPSASAARSIDARPTLPSADTEVPSVDSRTPAPVDGATVSGSGSSNSEKAQSPERSRFRDQIASSALPFSASSGASRALKPKAIISGGRIIELQPQVDAGPSSSRKEDSSVILTPPSLANDSIHTAIRSAVKAYARAVEMERGGQLDEALVSYRRAFKLNSNADRLYHRAQLLLSDPDVAPQQSDALLSSPAVAEQVRRALDIDDHRFVAIQERKAREAQAAERGETYAEITWSGDPPAATSATSTTTGEKQPVASSSLKSAAAPAPAPDQLAKLFGKLSIEGGGERDFSQVDFVPEDEEGEVILSRLPDEILLHVLRMVIAPRGRRGAKVVKPKLPSTTDELAAKQSRGGGSVKVDRTVPTSAASFAAAASNATTETASPAVGTTARRQHLGIGVMLGGADWQSLELIGRVCWKLRLLTRSSSLWKEIVRETYYPPLLDLSATSLDTLYARHHHDWRTLFINQPRVRLNGCYIAACHYARPGMSEESVWIRVVHVVEFYRSIRFLPDGRCLSLLTTEPPSETVRKLEPNLKTKGFAVGKWELFPHGLEDDEWEGRPIGPKVTVEDLRDAIMHKYAFRMVFALRQTTRGKWNKLELLEYFSVNLSNGEVLPLPQKHSKPFHFSRVIPYGV